MSNNSSIDFNTALLDVRKGYRLLHAYQTRVLDLVKYISKKMGLSFRTGWPWYTDLHPRGSKVHLDNWAFDWLSMYLYEFNILDQLDEKSGLALSVVIIPDTGFFDRDMQWSDRNLVSSFNPVDQSESRLLLMAGKHKWHPGAEAMKNLFKKDAVPYVDKDEKGVFLVKSYPLASFMNASTTDASILDFIGFCQKEGISDFALL